MSSGLETNKIVASVLVAALIGMFSGVITNMLYKPNHNIDKRGYKIDVVEEPAEGAANAPAPAPVDVAALMATADGAKGKDNFAKCAICHDDSKGGPNKVGPNLWGVYGSKKAGRPDGYTYSDAMNSKGGNWTDEDLFHFLNGPKTFVPGTKMGFAGFKNPQDIANMIAFLKTLKD